MVFHWSRSDSKSPRISRTFLSILVDLAMVWTVSILPLISYSSSLFIHAFRNRSKCTNDNWYHCQPHVPQLFFFCIGYFSGKIQVFVNVFAFFNFHSVVRRNNKTNKGVISLFDYYYLLIRVFHIRVSRWSFTGVRVTAGLLKSPRLFSVI